ncbi:ciliogenesis and planar polarity effector 1-like [Branchiostoma lanceolatum]|uniref:ciliogenesis and planar polarity effector 1-like n=1 Tax=Branchiostoma lanceolatum TaxID=7740 RepID=UPI0034546B0D
MDHRRLSLLYLPSGKTKRKITKVNKMLPNTLCMNTSRNGSYLAGLLTTGEVFVWHKDTDLLRTTAPLPNMEDSTASSSRRHLVYISNEGGKILVVCKDGKVHIWQKDDHSSHLASPQKATGKITELSGRWYKVGGGKTQLPEVDCKEVAIDAVFFQDQVQGNCCRCSFVFNNGRTFTVSTAILHWHEKADSLAYGPMPFSVTWMVAQRPLAAAVPDSTLIRSRGAYLACYTNDGQVLAVACNQWQPKDTKVMFVSVFTSTAVEANMSSCGAKTCDLPPKILRTYWICGMRWTCDDLLLVCITKRGSVVILTRLGEPVTLTTHGCSVEMGPSLYLPLHPLIMYSPGQENIHPSKIASQSSPPSTSEIDPLKQRFSIATHPRLPIILCSDGYMVTVMQLPSNLTTPNVLKTLCVEANQVLSNLGVRPMLGATLTRVFGQSSFGDKGKSVTQWRKVGTGLKMLNMNRTEETNSFTGAKSSTVKKGGLPRYSFEEPTDSGDLSQSESDVSTVGANVSKPGLASGDEGKIFFGDHDLVNETVVRPEKAKTPLELAEGVSSTLLCAWGLSLSYSGQWTWELEVITRHIADCLVKLVSHLLQDEGVRAEKKKKGKTKKERSGVSKALVLFRHALNMTNWDSVHQHCLPCVVRMVHGVTGHLLGRVRGHDIRVRGQLEALAGCQHLLRFAEERLNRAYLWNSGIGGKLGHGR